jgi:hypothetical protein
MIVPIHLLFLAICLQFYASIVVIHLLLAMRRTADKRNKNKKYVKAYESDAEWVFSF